MEKLSTTQEQERQSVEARCSPWADEMWANFGEPELGSIFEVLDGVNLWFGRAGMEEFIDAVTAGRADSVPLPRLLQVHIWPIGNFDQWPQLAQFIGDELTAKLQAMHTEAMAKPAVRFHPSDERFSKAMEENSCEAKFEADPLSVLQVVDILLAEDRHARGVDNE